MADLNRTNINWFPGHMAKARREIQEKLNYVDIVLEIVDARIPLSSRNPMMNEIVKNKPTLILLNKASLADKKETINWIKYFENEGLYALDIDLIDDYNIKKIIPYIQDILKEKLDLRKEKGIISQTVRALVLGIPNVGKSTFINKMAKRKAAQTGDKPGVTKSQTWIKVSPSLELLDTPGILWPKFESEEVALNLALVGSIKDEVLDLDYVSNYAIMFMIKNYKDNLEKRYEIQIQEEDEVLDIYEKIARKKGCILRGNEVDYDRVIKMIINDLRHQKLGAMTYDKLYV